MVLPVALLPRLVVAVGIATAGLIALLVGLLYRTRKGLSLYAALALGIAFRLASPFVHVRTPDGAVDPLGRFDMALSFLLPLFAWGFLFAFLNLPMNVFRRALPVVPIGLAVASVLAPASAPLRTLMAVVLLGLTADVFFALVKDRRRAALSTALLFFGAGCLLLGALGDAAVARGILALRAGVPLLGVGFFVFSLVVLVVMADEDRRLFVQATTDALTGLANRIVFLERARLEVQRAERTGRSVAVVLLDLDRFKAVNDRYGHAAGDRVLAGAAQAIARTVRGIDLAARWGGEEFVVLLVEADESSAGAAVERIREAVASAQPPRVPATVTVSAGIAIHHGLFERARIDALIKRADEALYEAKRKGRNRAEFEKARAARPTSPADVPIR